MKPHNIFSVSTITHFLKRVAICAVLFAAVNISAKNIVINNPAIDFNPGGITHITKIELADDETRVFVLDKFIPGWWIKYQASTYLEDCATGKRWQIRDIVGGKIDERMYMVRGGSGDSARILIFEPVDKTVKKVNLVQVETIPDNESDGKDSYIYGISLNPKDEQKLTTVPSKVQKWLNAAVAKAKRKTLLDIDNGEFFVKDSARIVGYIKGYDKRADFHSGSVLPSEKTFNIDNDGRFECVFALENPQYASLAFGNFIVNFYIEPKQTLSVVLDWEEFRKADRKRNIAYIFIDVVFGGATAEINTEMCRFFAKLPDYNTRNLSKQMSSGLTDEKFKILYDNELGEYNKAFQSLLQTEKLQPRAKKLLQIFNVLNQQRYLFNFGYFDLLQDFPKNDLIILAFQPIYSFAQQLDDNSVRSSRTDADKLLKKYLFDELKLTPTDDELQFFSTVDSLPAIMNNPNISQEQKQEFMKSYREAVGKFTKKYEKEIAYFLDKYYPQMIAPLKDSIFTNVLKIKPSLLYNLTLANKYNQTLETRSLNDSEKAEVKRIFTDFQLFAQQLLDKSAQMEKILAEKITAAGVIVNETPQVENEALMDAILEKYKGKAVFVDFWATWCGPCLSAMKTILPIKQELQDKGVVFLYLTGETSPLAAWKKKIPEIHGEHYYLTDTQWRFICDKFGITGIPTYQIYNKNGEKSEQFTGYPGNDTVKKAMEKIW